MSSGKFRELKIHLAPSKIKDTTANALALAEEEWGKW